MKKQILILSIMLFSNNISIKAQQVVSVPTLEKFYWWRGSNWDTYTSNDKIYSNNKLTSEIIAHNNGTEPYSKNEYLYNSDNKLSQINRFGYDNGAFIHYERQTNKYYNGGLKEIILFENLDLTTQNLLPSHRNTKIKDSYGRIIYDLTEHWVNNEWIINQYKKSDIVYYNNSPKYTQRIDSIYDTNTKKLKPYYKEIRNYNHIGELNCYKSFTYISGIEELFEYDSLYYNSNTGIIKKIVKYNKQNFPNLIPEYIKDSILLGDKNSSFIDDVIGKQVIGYVGYNGNKLYDRFKLDYLDNFGSYRYKLEYYSINRFEPYSRDSYIYDSHKNLIESTYELYNKFNSNWYIDHGIKSEYIYENNNLILNINKDYNKTSNSFVNTNKYEYSNFISISTNINKNEKLNTSSIFPNPYTTNDQYLNLNLNQNGFFSVKIADLNGKVIFENNRFLYKGLNLIDINPIDFGLYILTIKNENLFERIKLVVSK